jgi:retron-type reverse transcriptase
MLRAAYLALKREAAPGVDGTTWQSYAQALDSNLQDLSERLKRGAYRTRPVRRVYIPKADGRQRPLGVTALEDKIVQRAAVAVLNAIYVPIATVSGRAARSPASGSRRRLSCRRHPISETDFLGKPARPDLCRGL